MRVSRIEQIVSRTNQPPYRKKQVLDAVYKSYAKSYSDITNIPKELQEALATELGNKVLSIKNIAEANDNQALKVLFETVDKKRIEAVLMQFKPNQERDDARESLCISSQSGCAMGCKFCATGTIGLKKNLTADEITDQILYFLQQGDKIDSVSFMGMGEPLANPNIYEALQIITDKDKMGFSPRRVSLSTVGIIPGIKRMQKEFPNINLGFSLHSPFPDQRAELVPASKAYPISEVMKALKEYVEATNKRVLIAYTLFDSVNDSLDHAEALGRLIKARGAKSYLFEVKLIRFNPGPTINEFKEPKTEKIRAFQKVLDDFGVKNTLRQSFGADISAACGQLYGNYRYNT